LGYSLKALYCGADFQDCRPCPIKDGCAYGYLFETPVPSPSEVMKLYTFAPHPLVVEEPAERAPVVIEGEEVDFSFVLMGRALNYAAFLTRALERLGHKGLGRDKTPFELTALFDQSGALIWERGRLIAPPSAVNLSFAPEPSRKSTLFLRFLTPLRLKVGGKISSAPEPFDLVSSLTRRLFLLRYFHGDGQQTDWPSVFFEAANEAMVLKRDFIWRASERYSTRKKSTTPLSGVTGSLLFVADAGVLAPLFRLGQYVHLGKGAIFGLGRFDYGENYDG
jgi:hypothetical protein